VKDSGAPWKVSFGLYDKRRVPVRQRLGRNVFVVPTGRKKYPSVLTSTL
jgi:hypothetical protein